ncbi:MAG: EamA/RhaT family transporter [Planctomycetota bacterium]
MNDFPVHLFLPFAASLLFVCGLLCVKRASGAGTGPWTVTFVTNMWAALLFSFLWLRGGEIPSVVALWQPTLIAALYILGQIFTFAAISHGDVSVATPVFGVKVIVVAVLLSIFGTSTLSATIWAAAGLAAVGIMLVQWNPSLNTDAQNEGAAEKDGEETNKEVESATGSLFLTVVLALCAATSFGTFDVVVQAFTPAWGAGRILPIAFWISGVLSLGFLPFCERSAFRLFFATENNKAEGPAVAHWALYAGGLLVAMQAICIVFAIGNFGDAARVNVVYTLRGMWGVVLAWAVAIRWGGAEAELPTPVMLLRLIGASLLTAAVIMVVLAETS